ncbi:MAG: hypothetical protein MJ219_00540 [Mycoplasmoidaceae bacterium]|nr:hypothetical protein [Mycoplasmoidaceae bacterium]
MRKLHILIPSILIASTIPMVSMVGCNKQPEPEVVHVTRVEIAQESKNINV